MSNNDDIEFQKKVNELEILLKHNVDNRFRLTSQGVGILIQLYRNKTGVNFTHMTWCPGYREASDIQRKIISYMVYALSNSYYNPTNAYSGINH